MLILNYDSTEIVPGGAGNAAGNVAALGGAARLVGVAGRDETGRRLLGDAASAPHRRRRRAPPGRLPHADQDAHPRRRHPLGQAAGRPHRSRRGDAGRRRRTRAAFESRVLRARRAAPTRCWFPTTAAAWSRRRSSPRRASLARRKRATCRILVDSRYDLLTLPRHDRVHAERVRGRAGARRPDRRQHARARARRPRAAAADARARGADHARQPRHGAVRAGPADGAHPDRRIRSDRRRHRRRRHRDRDDDAGAQRRARRSRRPRAWPTTPAASS